ncbi:DUF4304 domain-containing protein [Aliikangiella marina]|uniref:DUF4304 domain-containing protein n=1 Tax=Aliikangiella marina TaxID=1712262 RepID=A0A545TA70_9GAMM|nr:DUF4304 domain-containing protein [Aliikangiella marina]TQV74105.1 DUF4304 domain-containing protein [Aliikangiella marina]
MSEISKLIDECIKLGIAKFLKSHGFNKSGRNWHKEVDNNWQIVNVQASSGNFASEGRFAINLGVYISEIESYCGNTLNGKPKEYDSTIGIRLGSTDSASDFWWEIDAKSDLQSISNDVVQKLESQGISWLNHHLDISNVSNSLNVQPSVQSFSAALLSGNEEEAKRRVIAAIEDRPRAEAHFKRWSTKAGLEL